MSQLSEHAGRHVRAVVVGGGISGLCTAFYLTRRLGQDQVLLLEGGNEAGGHMRTDEVDGYVVDWGPNGFLDREPLTLQWVDDLGVSDQLIRANEKAAHRFILKKGRLVEVLAPPKFLLQPLLSIPGRIRLCCEGLIPGKKDDEPETIWDFAARRIGREAADTLVTPMVTGIFGGDAKQLSLEHAFPRMAEMERQYGSLTKAMLSKRKTNKAVSAAGPGGVLTSFAGGVGFLSRVAAERLGEQVVTGANVTGLRQVDGQFEIQVNYDMTLRADQVVVATPAFAASKIIHGLDASLSDALGRIAYADIAVLCTGYRREKVGHDMDGFGFLVPKAENRRVLGCIWTSSIFPHEAPEDMVLLRTMYGGFNDPGAVMLNDSELLDYLNREVHSLLDISGEPDFVRIFRHRRGIPQYLIGHGQILREIEAAEERYPGLAFAGNAYRGVGLNDCVISAHRAVDALCR